MARAKKPGKPVTDAQKRRIFNSVLALAKAHKKLELRIQKLKKFIRFANFGGTP
jgi:hypothetical protein